MKNPQQVLTSGMGQVKFLIDILNGNSYKDHIPYNTRSNSMIMHKNVSSHIHISNIRLSS